MFTYRNRNVMRRITCVQFPFESEDCVRCVLVAKRQLIILRWIDQWLRSRVPVDVFVSLYVSILRKKSVYFRHMNVKISIKLNMLIFPEWRIDSKIIFFIAEFQSHFCECL